MVSGTTPATVTLVQTAHGGGWGEGGGVLGLSCHPKDPGLLCVCVCVCVSVCVGVV